MLGVNFWENYSFHCLQLHFHVYPMIISHFYIVTLLHKILAPMQKRHIHNKQKSFLLRNSLLAYFLFQFYELFVISWYLALHLLPTHLHTLILTIIDINQTVICYFVITWTLLSRSRIRWGNSYSDIQIEHVHLYYKQEVMNVEIKF